MKAKASGRLRHCFFGTYSAIIALSFEDAYQAAQALPKLGKDWKVGEKSEKSLVWSGNSKELKAVKEVLGSFGADVEKIDSIKKSIDFGEAFEVAIEIVPEEQLAFPIA
jgi:hypothetical protein